MCRFLLASLVALGVACDPQPPSDAPIQLIGVWTTDSASHADRYLEFSARTVTFGTGNHGSVTHFIEAISTSPGERDGATHYEVAYRDGSGESSRIGLTYEATQPLPSLVLDHREDIWRPRLHKPGEQR